MVTQDRKCSVCGSDAFLDHVEVMGSETIMYYSCSNEKCREFNKAYTTEGIETQSMIKPKEQSLFE